MSRENLTPEEIEQLEKKYNIKINTLSWEEFQRLQRLKIRSGEKHYTCSDIARELGQHRDTIYKWFKDYPGVLEIPHPAQRIKDPETREWRVKKKHSILLIPADVYMRWRREHSEEMSKSEPKKRRNGKSGD